MYKVYEAGKDLTDNDLPKGVNERNAFIKEYIKEFLEYLGIKKISEGVRDALEANFISTLNNNGTVYSSHQLHAK